MMFLVIYICCAGMVDATVYATELGIALRQQQSEARIISNISQVPLKCVSLDIRATPEFWTWFTHPAATGITPRPPSRGRRSVAEREAQLIQRTRTIATAVRLRGGTIRAPHDLPAAMDRASIEEWLNREG